MSPIFTKHALERIRERKFGKDLAEKTFLEPDKKSPGKQSGTIEFTKKFGNEIVTLIGKQNPSTSLRTSEWLILSAWIDPPRPGTRDARKKEDWEKYQRAGFWGKLWYVVKEQLGF